jgi:Bacterial Ig-like domain (group 2)
MSGTAGMMIRQRVIVVQLLVLAAGSASGCTSHSPSAPTSPTITAIAVTGASLLDVGQTAQLTATATLSDGSNQNVTATATWSSSNASVLTVSAAGVATATNNGDADVRVTHQSIVGIFHVAVGARSQPVAPVKPTPVPTPPSPAPTPPPGGMFCGAERWAVKTLSDPDAVKVEIDLPVPITIAALNALPPHCAGLPEKRTFLEEFRVFEVTGIVLRTTNEANRDISIALADPHDVTRTIVVAIVEPTCAGAIDSPFRALLQEARLQYTRLGALTGRIVRVRGVGFYDFDHGQIGQSRSCIELHPVIGISQ